MPFVFLLGCAYTVRTMSQVSPGGAEAEFYAVVQAEYFDGIGRYPRGRDTMVIRCAIADTASAHETTCQRVLTDEQAFSVVERDVPTTFPLKRTPEASAAAAKQQSFDRGIAAAITRLDDAEVTILRESLNVVQSETVRTQARKEACALIATVTDRPCDAVLQDAGR